MKRLSAPLAVLLPLLLSCPEPTEDPLVVYSEEREVCTVRTPERRLLFGDLHVHTGFSFDARSYELELSPGQAHDFARGEAVQIPPTVAGQGTREVRLERPLDFVSITDHGEFLGEVAICTDPSSAGYDSAPCARYRDPDGVGGASVFGSISSAPDPTRQVELCGADGAACTDRARSRWEEMQAAAEAAYDRTADCSFTAFPGYEYTNTLGVSNLHRNVFFRNAQVPELPITYYEAPTVYGLFEQLQEGCLEGVEGCDVITIAHNSNLSNGHFFLPHYEGEDDVARQAELAALRARLEPLVELFQHKGDSECRNGFGQPDDPLCSFEKLRPADAEICDEDSPGSGGMRLWGCVHRLDFVRQALLEGLVEEQRIGVNPYPLGFGASTDTHNGTPGLVDNHDFPGHVGTVDDTPEERHGSGVITHDGLINNPGGLTAVWAVENSRDAIFDAFQRRETYAVSGPRIGLRFFGGSDLPADLCSSEDRIQRAYETGVPMGGELSPDSAPRFLVEAWIDAGTDEHPGTPLQQVQIIKGWIDESGVTQEEVLTVAGNADNGAAVDTATCDTSGPGEERLCTVWEDPAWAPGQAAFYYARVVENPTCRWSAFECARLAPEERPEACDTDEVPKAVQHRAWSSPIQVR